MVPIVPIATDPLESAEMDKVEGPWKVIVSILAFPLFFQGPVLEYMWGAQDDTYLQLFKRVFLLWPTLALIFACWITIPCVLSLIVRAKRRQFVSHFFVTWWDFGRAVFAYWGGIFKFVFVLLGALYGLIRTMLLGILLVIKDIIMMPVRLVTDAGQVYFKPGVPWTAVAMMTGWAFLEALIFTFVMTPLVSDVLGSLVGGELKGPSLQIPLYFTFLIFALGSYAVIHSLGEAIKEREIGKIIVYSIVEVIVALVETVFLYREFVDALVPWFAQHAGDNFHLGITGTLGIAFFVWLAIRAMTWFLFGSSGIPTMMAIIQRTGLEEHGGKKGSFAESSKEMFAYTSNAIEKLQKDMDWVQEKGDEVLSAFMLPPLQILASCINFCTLLVSSSHLFDLPFKKFKDVLEARNLLVQVKKSVADD